MRGKPFVALVLLALLGPVGCTAAEPAPPDDPSPPSPTARPSVEPPSVPSAPDLPAGDEWSIEFADEEHAFALPWTSCRTNMPEARCPPGIAVLSGTDGWALRQTPGTPTPGTDMTRDLLVAAPGVARLSLPDGVTGYPTCWVTTDAAVTWAETSCTASGETEEAPEGARLVPARTETGTTAIHALAPETGELLLLTAQPGPVDAWSGDWGELADGTFWCALDVGFDDPRRVALTRDRGRTWERPAAPARHGDGPSVTSYPWLVAARDGLYLFERGSSRQSQSTLLGVHHSADGGASWDTRWARATGETFGTPLGPPVLTSDGRILLYAQDAVRVSEDGGRTFTVERPGAPPERPATTPFGYLLTDRERSGHFRLSIDGFTWRTVILGRTDG
ncbi:sialidase family protein [Streptomyces avicenniae]|uniref:sialidase family protein n=1 Tax=Streptomyces avicenniae TaxID=500153 RepID=UPI00069B6E7C|nr:sialidase family protein [Streptomyces avicenniae]